MYSNAHTRCNAWYCYAYESSWYHTRASELFHLVIIIIISVTCILIHHSTFGKHAGIVNSEQSMAHAHAYIKYSMYIVHTYIISLLLLFNGTVEIVELTQNLIKLLCTVLIYYYHYYYLYHVVMCINTIHEIVPEYHVYTCGDFVGFPIDLQLYIYTTLTCIQYTTIVYMCICE